MAPTPRSRGPVDGAGGPFLFSQVYEEHVDFVWRSARAFGIPPTAIEDIVQDVFVVVHRRLVEFEGRASVRTWIARILLNVVREHRRAFARHATHTPLEPETIIDPVSERPDDAAERLEAARLLSDLLEHMQEDQRVVFVLAEMEGMSMPEIAASLGVNENTAYSRLRLARREYTRQLARLRAGEAWRRT